MIWYRMKTVLIFLFLAINLFLLGLLGAEWFSARQTEKETAEAAISLLQKNGITVSAKVPHMTKKLSTLTLQNPKADAENFAAGILGGRAIQMGDAWRREGREVTFLERGFRYESGKARAEAVRGSINTMRAALADMGISMDYTSGTVENGAVHFVQEIDGIRLFDFYLTVYPAADGTVAAMEGVWAEITEKLQERTRIRPAADALLMFLRESEKKRTVTSITCGYAVLLAENGYRTADAVPAWRIETEDGAQYFYDARQ